MSVSANSFHRLVLESARRLALPIATYPGLRLTGAKVSDVVTDAGAQIEVQIALRERYQTPFVLTAMDLSAEAEAFGCAIAISETEVPTVTGRLVTDVEQARKLGTPKVGDRRTGVYLETTKGLAALPGQPMVFGGCIGPFSLAARLVGVREALEMTVTDPEIIHILLEKSAEFLAAYIAAFKRAGAAGVIMAEPAAGLLSPRGLSRFSSAYIRQIGAAIYDDRFALVLHNCAAKLLHLPVVLETGLKTFHFGAPMDILAALDRVPPEVVLCGNLDPVGVFVQLSPAETKTRAIALLDAAAQRRNFVLSSGCDLPPDSSLDHLDAFYAALNGARPFTLPP